jgi:hypothetical protein
MITAVEWLEDNLLFEPWAEEHFKYNSECWEKAIEMEKEQIVKHSVELMKILISNPFETSGKTPTELMDNYFKETFKQQEQ